MGSWWTTTRVRAVCACMRAEAPYSRAVNRHAHVMPWQCPDCTILTPWGSRSGSGSHLGAGPPGHLGCIQAALKSDLALLLQGGGCLKKGITPRGMLLSVPPTR